MSIPSGVPEVFADPYAAKTDVVGRVVAVLRGTSDRRGLAITGYRSRATPSGQIHELMTTPDTADFNSVVERVALLAFFEVVSGGVILVGDLVEIGGRRVGVVAGFNDTHMPNHQNICLSAIELLDGESRGLSCGDVVRFFSGQSAARSAPGS